MLWRAACCKGVITYGSPIFKVVREKRCKALYTPATRSPTAPEYALVTGSERSNGDRTDAPPPSPSRSRPETLQATARLSDEPFLAWHYRHTAPLTWPLQTPTDDGRRTR